MREQIYSVIGDREGNRAAARWYNTCAMIIALLSTLPLMFHNPEGTLLSVLEKVDTFTVYLLFLDYILCWMTSDFKMKKHTPWAFILYPLTPLALLNLLSILPSLGLLPAQFTVLRLFRLLKVLQYSKSCTHIVNVFKKEWRTLFSVLIIALFYIFISALVMFVEEPAGTFNDFFHALYWATTALTTVGYGDVYPVTDVGRFISMVSSLFGIAIIALPAGIVTAGFVEALNEDVKKAEERKEQRKEQKRLAHKKPETEEASAAAALPGEEKITKSPSAASVMELEGKLQFLQQQQSQILDLLQKLEAKQHADE